MSLGKKSKVVQARELKFLVKVASVGSPSGEGRLVAGRFSLQGQLLGHFHGLPGRESSCSARTSFVPEHCEENDTLDNPIGIT